jgi:DNA repair protein RadA/Sms
MARVKTRYVCTACGRATPAYMGRCPRCGEFDTMQEEIVESKRPFLPPSAAVPPINRCAWPISPPTALVRMQLPRPEFSRVLGGGMVPGSIVLVGGDPGIGKSTLLLQVAALVANQHGPVLYISGEESASQIKMRADRLNLTADDLFLVTETNLAVMLDHIQETKAGAGHCRQHPDHLQRRVEIVGRQRQPGAPMCQPVSGTG